MSDRPRNALSILIVDDEPLARNRLAALCQRMNNIGSVHVAKGGQQAMEMIEIKNPDLLLLDVDMPDISGIEVAQRCRSLGRVPEIIFTTAHSKYAVQAFRLEATDYLLKPVKQNLLAEALSRVSKRLHGLNDGDKPTAEHRIWVRDQTGSIHIECRDISWIGAQRDYMRVNLPGRSYMVHEPMQSLAGRLPGNMFIRIHRSTMVQKNFIREFRRDGRRHYVVLMDGTQLSIGASYVGGLGLSETVTE